MPGEDIQSWSTTAAVNATADTSINWAEGQPRASVNNSARSMMAAHAKQRNLFNGSIVTGGTPDALTFISGVGYTSIPNGMRVLVRLGATNTGPATLNMDGIAITALLNRFGSPLVAGDLVADALAEFVYVDTHWRYLGTGSGEFVNTTGDTMTGALTVPSLTSAGAVSTASLAATGAVTAATVTTTGAVSVGATVAVGTGLSLLSNAAASMVQFASNGWKLSFDPASGFLYYINFAGTPLHTFRANGDLVITGDAGKPGGGVWADTSDARIKTVLGDYTSGLTAVNSLKPVRYTFKGNDQARDTKREFIGLVAQEVEPHMPEMVKYSLGKIDGKDVSDLRILDTGALIFALVNCVQELTQRLEALEEKV